MSILEQYAFAYRLRAVRFRRQLTRDCGFLQLPRPRWLETSTRFGAYWLAGPSGVLLRRCYLALHGFVIARQV